MTSPLVVVTRPAILSGIHVLGAARGYRWRGLDLEHIPTDGPVIFAANHASHADTAAILGTLPKPMRPRTCVAAALDVFGRDNGHVGVWHSVKRECLQTVVAAGFHAFAFDRHGPPRTSLRSAIDLVRRGWHLLLYPEGTRSRTGQLGPFKAGVGVVARMTERPVVPVFVRGGADILPCGTTIPRAGTALVRYGEPLRPDPSETSRSFTTRLRHTIERMGSLAPWPAEATPAASATRSFSDA